MVFFFFLSSLTRNFQLLDKSRGHTYRPSSPPVRTFIFIAQGNSAFPTFVDFRRNFAISRPRAFCGSNFAQESPREYEYALVGARSSEIDLSSY